MEGGIFIPMRPNYIEKLYFGTETLEHVVLIARVVLTSGGLYCGTFTVYK